MMEPQIYVFDLVYNNLDDEGREVNTMGPKVVHVPFNSGRTMSIFDRLRLRQMEMLGLMDSDYDSDADYSDEDGLEGDFFDAPTASQLFDEAAELRAEAERSAQTQKVDAKPEHASHAPGQAEPPQQAAE